MPQDKPIPSTYSLTGSTAEEPKYQVCSCVFDIINRTPIPVKAHRERCTDTHRKPPRYPWGRFFWGNGWTHRCLLVTQTFFTLPTSRHA